MKYTAQDESRVANIVAQGEVECYIRHKILIYIELYIQTKWQCLKCF